MANRRGESNSSRTGLASSKPEKSTRLAAAELPKGNRTGQSKEVSVNFNVTVPEGTAKSRRSVYLAGTLQQLNKNMPDWDPRGQEMKKVDQSHWTITLTGPANSRIEYKYTLGSWDKVEKDAHCAEIGNRQITLPKTKEFQKVEDVVQTWRDPGCG
jgi:hypothetical protein